MSSLQKPLEFAPGIWKALMHDLWVRGLGQRESGAFLVASRRSGDCVREWVSYDDLEPKSLHLDFVKLETCAFGRLWDLCDRHGLKVLADVHTHTESPRQSESDRQHPMVGIPGHIALIVPNLAFGDVTPADVTFNVYCGDSQCAFRAMTDRIPG